MKKQYLLAPGPTPVPERVAAILGQPIPHHRTPGFEKTFAEVREGLKWLFQTKAEVIMLTATGTGAMDAAVSNLFRRGEKVVTINGGKFGERWTKIAKVYGLVPIEVKIPSGEAISPTELAKILDSNKDAKAILFQASETSTGSRMPVKEIVDLAKKNGMLSVCDAITAAGVMDLPMDAWGIDVMITGSQKAMMIPPGLAFIALSPEAWKKSESADLPKFYFDLAKEKKAHETNQTAWTPAISLVLGLGESLKMLREEGLPAIFKRHEMLARATRAAVAALGLEVLAKKSPSPAVTAVLVPSSVKDGKQIVKRMRDQYGVTIAGGQDELEGKIFRLSHFGYCSEFDITTGISCLELVLAELGHPVTFGTGVGAALKVFSEAAV
jgi:aspartate aminotransferase-like enzyme